MQRSGTGALQGARKMILARLMAMADRRRQLRYRRITALIGLQPDDRVLDVGCAGARSFGGLNHENAIIGLDLGVDPAFRAENFLYVCGSAVALPFAEQSIEVVYSNSVIEHIPDPADQARMAAEVRRVGHRYYVQTPNRYFFPEPHFLIPCFQFFPERLQAWIANHWTPAAALGWYPSGYEHIRLLNRADLVRLFPDATIYAERWGPLTKSYMVVGGGEDSAGRS